MNTSDFEHATKVLSNHFGTYTHAAKALGISPGHFRKIRNGRATLTPVILNLVCLEAQKIENFRHKSQDAPAIDNIPA